jgi:hypothetical protein
LKLNITWVKCRVARFLSLRQGFWGGGDRTANWNKFMNLAGTPEQKLKTGAVPLKLGHMVSLPVLA